MGLIQKARDYFYILRKGRKVSKVNGVREIWTARGKDYYELQENLIKEKGIEFFAQNELFDFIAQTEFTTIFELGCGYGWNIQRLFREYPEKNIVGLDFSRPQLLNSRVYPELRQSERVIMLEGDITNMGLADQCVDVSFSLGILMNIPPSSLLEGLKEIVRVTRKKIILFEYFKPNVASREIVKGHENHPYIYSHDYEKMMVKLGCRAVRIDENRCTASDRYTFYEFEVPDTKIKVSGPHEFGRQKIIACTKCKGPLKDGKSELICGECALSYIVEDDIPNMILSNAVALGDKKTD